MAQMFKDEKNYADNAVRKNFIFLGYPYAPPLPADDYRAVTQELQKELPIRLWYFLDEVTTQELMRKIWRAILRADHAVFDISGGNPNVALELGMALAIERPSITLLMTGQPNPLGTADLGYSERAEYTSRESLKSKVKELLVAKSTALKQLKDVSYEIQSDLFPFDRAEIEKRLIAVVAHVFNQKKITRSGAAKIFGNDQMATAVLTALRKADVFRLEGARKASKYILGELWVYHDHEVVGAAT